MERPNVFRFPNCIKEFQIINSRQHFHQLIRKCYVEAGVVDVKFHALCSEESIRFYCNDHRNYSSKGRSTGDRCCWHFQYAIKKDKNGTAQYHLTKVNPYHRHSTEQCLLAYQYSEKKKRITKLDESLLGLRDIKFNNIQTLRYIGSLKNYSYQNVYRILRQNVNKSEEMCLNFAEWLKIFKKKVEVYIEPRQEETVSNLPEIVFFVHPRMRVYYRQNDKGLVLGLHLYENKILDLPKNLKPYICLFFYTINSRQRTMVFAFGIFPDSNNIRIRFVQDGKQENLRVNMNLYKVLRLFFHSMGPVAETLFINQNEILESAVKYFIFKMTNPSNPADKYPKKLSYKVKYQQPFYSQKMASFLRKLLFSRSQRQYDETLAQAQKSANLTEAQNLHKFHEKRDKYRVFSEENRSFIGRWQGQNQRFFVRFSTQESLPIRFIPYLIKVVQCLVESAAYNYVRGKQAPICSFNIDKLFNSIIDIQQIRGYMQPDGFKIFAKEMFAVKIINIVDCEIFEQSAQYMKRSEFKEGFWSCKEQQNINSQIFISQKPDDNPYSLMPPLSEHFKQIKQHLVSNQQQSMQEEQTFNVKLPEEEIELIRQLLQESRQIDQQQEQQKAKNAVLEQLLLKNDAPLPKGALNPKQATYEQLYPLRPKSIMRTVPEYPYRYTIKEESEVFICTLSLEKSDDPRYFRIPIYQCSCRFRQALGIPCRHIMKICIFHKISMRPYINKYWILKWSYVQERQYICYKNGLQMTRAGYPRRTKRNCMANR